MEPQQMTYLDPQNQPEQRSRGLGVCQMVEAKFRKFIQEHDEQLAILVG
jgi:hypothetical protein